VKCKNEFRVPYQHIFTSGGGGHGRCPRCGSIDYEEF